MGSQRKAKSSFASAAGAAPEPKEAPGAAEAGEDVPVQRSRRRAAERAPAASGEPVAPEAPEEPEEPAAPSPFLQALIELLSSRGLDIPPGLAEAPPAAYAGQGAGTVQMMARLKDVDLLERAAKVAGWQGRQEERSVQAWESSPLIREIRRRGLQEPPRPARVASVAFSMKKPLAEWEDAELLGAAAEWAKRA